MTTFALVAALVGVLSTAVIYGTDLFCALVVRPAAAGAADSSVADLLGRIHEFGDRRLPVPGVLSIVAAAAATATAGTGPARLAGAAALVALIAWLVIYLRISAPINKRLRAAAATRTVPADTAELQRRWDGVITPRAVLQTVALAGLLAVVVLL
ncbi:DUF1772 domain-containing protein [Pseudonocardia broussonetiae]|uniref:DUF1772 domain-containing protein n=1 Tax=Pseudonocardia broussonetiae TaxID=2736640 RepID=A0A6M6JS23_9PSEU|nr:DUF1772 domain-containing protein [Pseudonocardia broussonetiae]QJY49916.1 DUF1772 domain-containing protein [Pseudonocardia broussonetiae]